MNYIIILAIITVLLIFFFIRSNKKYTFSIMAIFKNENEYMEEWLDLHISQGIDHFYLYSNDENMVNYKFLDKYTCITLIPWTNVKNDENGTIQKKAYYHCVQNYSNETQYLMMVDIDEFLTPTKQNIRVIDFINSIDPKTTKAIKIQRYDFGSNGHIKKPTGKVTDNYLKHETICSSYKTIANTDFINKNVRFYGVHDFVFLNKPGKIYNAYFDYKYTGFPNGCNKNNINEVPIVLNHYYTKSYEEYMTRCNMWKDGGVNNINYRKNCEKLFHEKNKNETDGQTN